MNKLTSSTITIEQLHALHTTACQRIRASRATDDDVRAWFASERAIEGDEDARARCAEILSAQAAVTLTADGITEVEITALRDHLLREDGDAYDVHGDYAGPNADLLRACDDALAVDPNWPGGRSYWAHREARARVAGVLCQRAFGAEAPQCPKCGANETNALGACIWCGVVYRTAGKEI
jgi:hypothetical protein